MDGNKACVSVTHDGDPHSAGRSVAFPEIQEEKLGGHSKGVELKKSLTQEEMDLAAAGYDHIEQQKHGKAESASGAHAAVELHEHKLPLIHLQGELKTSFDSEDPSRSLGLAIDEAQIRFQRDGANVLTPPKKKSALRKFLERLFTMFNLLLLAAGVMLYILLGGNNGVFLFQDNFQNTYLGAILISVAFMNAGIDFYQIQKSEAILASFLAMIPPSCRVIRDGKLGPLPASQLVKGDVVLLRTGDKTPADLVLFSSSDLKVDNSSLTGESEPQERHPLPKGSTHRAVEAENLIFNSTLVVNGEGWGIVVKTGDHTMIGQIARLTGDATGNQSPLASEIDHFVIFVSAIAIVFASVFFIVGITQVYRGKIGQTFTFAVSVLVAFVPEGLPSTVTLLLSIAAKRMAKRNVLVKDLQGVETLGRWKLTLLATDKTGTLTRNQMTVTNLWSGTTMYSAFQSHNDSEATQPFTLQASGMQDLVDNAALNSRIKFDRTDVPLDQRVIMGDATETGLLRFAVKQIPENYEEYVRQYPKVFEVPFNSVNKWAMSILQKPHKNGVLTLLMKGAPERVLSKCATFLENGDALPMTEDFKAAYNDAYDYMAARGHRVIACAQLALPGDDFPVSHAFSKDDGGYPTSGYCFVGLISLEDPPKHGVREAIGTLRLAGIKVMMVTGDHPKTAEAIARKINLVVGDTRQTLSNKTGRPAEDIYDDEINAVVIHGDDIDELQGWQWDQIFNKDEVVFARTSPQHKLEIVKRAQALGHIVGVTGDGVNDSPALKKADLGIAMNISGSDVSKEAANMILLDDNFASVVNGVQEGRQIFVNLKRSIQYTLSHSTPEVIPQLLYVVVPLPLPLSAILILVIDLGFELINALSFAWDLPETEHGLMRLKPRKPVTQASINALKRRALRKTKTLIRDPETGEVIPPSRFSVFASKIGAPFTREFWADRLATTENEALVDANLLTYSYLQAGMIECVGSLLAYFLVFYRNGFTPKDLRQAQAAGLYFKSTSPDYISNAGHVIKASQQVDALGQAQGIVYLSIFIMQCFNVFAVKARLKLPFGGRIIGNKWNFVAIFAAACLSMFIVYTPPLSIVFGGSFRLSPLYWLIPLAFGIFLLAWSCLRVLLMRRSVEQLNVRHIRGLMMFPTMRTLSMRASGSRQ
ncbi:aminophospholipid-transporting P-type ATPase [Coprinopsis marcescibilis]|uniref:Aminophospholipid-transporting P-type ATPase n=1 Tax=Coprinopsis marcescibilis TaxID=230819 RepID=A0A5C3L023_COPMA|nr:aminophospholipid-transporting P-type ATPase [Coprinopsis marcescibilis]